MEAEKKQTLDEYIAAHPYLAETADLFAALTQAVAAVEPVKLPDADEIVRLVSKGVPLLQQEPLQMTVVAAAAAALPDVLAGLSQHDMPAQFQSNLALWQAASCGAAPGELQQVFVYILQEDAAKLGAWAEAHALAEAAVRAVGWTIISAFVPDEVKDAAFWEEKAGWKRNYCPVCGRQPVLAQLRQRQEGHARFLVCDGCHTSWHYLRVGCVYCGNADLKHMHVLEPEQEPSLRLDVCDECHTYLKTYVGEENGAIYLKDWTTLPLDMLAAEQKLQKKGSILLAGN